jgi:hydrogenase expression/formation protein HypD
MKGLSLNGFIAPGHVSTIIGMKPYEIFPRRYGIPTVVTGFEPLDILFAICIILKQLRQNKPALENEYTRAVKQEGNTKAQILMQSVYETTDGKWRGLGTIASSKLKLREKYATYDAQIKHGVKIEDGVDLKLGCKCHLVVIGKIRPAECPLFMKTCTPQNPIGACMVSTEGTCRICAKVTKSYSEIDSKTF